MPRENAKKCRRVIGVDLILENVLKHVKFEDLKNCRLVCKKWNEFATREMTSQSRKICPLDFITFPPLLYAKKPLELELEDLPESDHTMENFIMTFEKSNTSAIPKSFYLNDFDAYCNYDSINSITLRIFLQKFAQCIQHLEIRYLQYESVLQEILEDNGLQFRDVVNLAGLFDPFEFEYEERNDEEHQNQKPGRTSANLTNLRSLKICAAKRSSVRILKSLVKNLMPRQLVKLALNYSELSNPSYQMEKAINYLIKYDQIRNLKSLILTKFNSETLFNLIKQKIQLESLKIGGFESDDRGLTPISEFLSHSAPTLKKLTWTTNEIYFSCSLKTIALKTLKIILECDDPDVRKFKGIEFSSTLPNLECLHIETSHEDDHCIADKNMPPLVLQMLPLKNQAVNTWRLKLTNDLLSPELMTRIPKIFPQLISLSLIHKFPDYRRPYEEIFQEIWRSVEFSKSLKELEIWMDDDLRFSKYWEPIPYDNIFCGLDAGTETNAKNLKIVHKEGDETHYSFDLPGINSILNLKALERLEIFTHLEPRLKLTDVSGYGVFGQMQNLKTLSINNKAHNFTDSCLAYLRNKIHTFSQY